MPVWLLNGFLVMAIAIIATFGFFALRGSR